MTFLISSILVVVSLFAQNPLSMPTNPEDEIKMVAGHIDGQSMEALPLRDRGRLKPMHTFARENLLFLTGKYSLMSLNPVDLYFALIIAPSSDKLEIINIRSPRVRELLGFSKERRLFSFAELQKSAMEDLVKPLLIKEEQNTRLLEPQEKEILEVYNQFWLFQGIRSGSHFLNALIYNPDDKMSAAAHSESDNELLSAGKSFLQAISQSEVSEVASARSNVLQLAKKAPLPDLFQSQRAKLEIEVLYNKSRIFFVTALLLAFLGIFLILDKGRKNVFKFPINFLFGLPFVLLVVGFAIRVYITGFAPVTNMFGTMIWVSLGITLFSLVLLFLYKNTFVVGCLWITSAGFLILTDSIPLILSPDLDPIVAVLRSNLWLTIHVLTIVISYAAFSIAMILGNVVVGRALISGKTNDAFVKEVSQSIYRMIQLGVFLLSVGIVLGGIWADYSWGRFWGWDPKETWALIADIGFLVILHARFVGWVGPFGIAVVSPLAYLLVIMAWYGVNFILAAGLHSYGFSSGGTAIVVTFVILQVLFLASFWVINFLKSRKV